MDSEHPFYAYKETRLDLDPSSTSSIISLTLPSPNGSTSTSQLPKPSKRNPNTDSNIAEDETTFRKRYLATSSEIYHRRYHTGPRSFLWRVLEDGFVLEIRVVDLGRRQEVRELDRVLRFRFPGVVVPGGIAFADPMERERDELHVFVLVGKNSVFTLGLRMEFFEGRGGPEEMVGEWCQVAEVRGLGFRGWHRVVALGAEELLVAVMDGSLLRLARERGSDGSVWKEIHYNEGAWNSFRSLIPFQGSNAVRYGDHNLELSVATAIASPGVEIDDVPYAFTVSLDHRLRIWNLASGKLAYMGDVVTQRVEPHDNSRQTIDPSQSQLVRVFQDRDGVTICAVYSPIDAGQFKFWSVTATMDGHLELEDMFPEEELVPKRPNSTEWTLTDFAVAVEKKASGTVALWVLWKNNLSFRLHKLEFRCTSNSRHENTWGEVWKAMAPETFREASLPSNFAGDASDSTDKWLAFILAPGRFSTATKETGLALYCRARGVSSKGLAKKSISLADRMCSSIASMVSLMPASNGNMDFAQFREATHVQWRQFYRLLLELDKLQGEAMSLVIDPEGNMPWVVLADGITAIRTCSSLERVMHNEGQSFPESEVVTRPLLAAETFRSTFSDALSHSCRDMALQEIFQEPSTTNLTRMREFYDKCDFAGQIGDEEYGQLVSTLGGHFRNLTPEVYDAIFDLMRSAADFDNERPQQLPNVGYGNKLTVKGVQETVELHTNVCLDQLVLLVFIECEINNTEEGTGFETAKVFGQLIEQLKRLELLKWLASTQITLPLKQAKRQASMSDNSPAASSKAVERTKTITVFEAVLQHLFSLELREGEDMPGLVTGTLLEICKPDSSYEILPTTIQCFLMANNRVDLATEFSRFAGDDALSTYFQGRTRLAANDALAAASLFKKAAYGIKDSSLSGLSRLLDEEDKKALKAGLPEYYAHISSLYEKEKAFSFVIDFSRLSLQFLNTSPPTQQTSPLLTKLHRRLFNASIQTSRYELAHSTLTLFTDPETQTSSLRTLITKMCESSHIHELISLPFIGLQDSVDTILSQKCQGISDVTMGIPYHKILYAWRIKRSDYRGAATISLERLRKLRGSGKGDLLIDGGEGNGDALETEVTREWVVLINCLSCVGERQAWILEEEISEKESGSGNGNGNGFGRSGNGGGNGSVVLGIGMGRKEAPKPKRRVVTLEELRRGYQGELDRIAAVQNGQFEFGAGGEEGDVMDIV